MQTDVGVVRERNEDAAYADPSGRFAILADGMGGHGGGDVASAMAVDVARTCLEASEVFKRWRGPRDRSRVRALLERTVRLCNDAIVARSKLEPDKHQMGTTLELVVVVADEVFIAHVGDSRTYLFRRGGATQLTTDHTVAEVMRRAGTLGSDEATRSPMRSVLCNAIGVTPGVQVEQAHAVLEAGDRLLLCSDGLYDYFADDELAALGTSGDLDGALAAMIAEARARGGHDNITGVAIQAGDDDAVVSDELDDVPTVPVARTSGPLGGLGDDALGSIVEQVLRETTQPLRN